MKLLITSLMMLSLSMLTACGGSGGSGSNLDEPNPSAGGSNEDPKEDSDLDNLQDTVANDVEENQRFAIAIEEYKDTNSYTWRRWV